ncbi:MAG: hypothetical protein GTN78_26120, partial [Gemmatimonadales bacterium]|nr:hypothetical protein [Gemmatimonadales bacterium]
LAVGGVALAGVLFSDSPADAQLLYPPQVLLEVHPNERAQGLNGGPRLGTAPWTSAGGPIGWYIWKVYKFAGSGNLWIQVCGQNFDAAQNAPTSGIRDLLQMRIDGVKPNDVWGIMSGAPGWCQWNGNVDKGKRLTLEFAVYGLVPGKHILQFYANGNPIIWWVKVTDLEERLPQ